jgi:hypothetical protein
LLQRRGVYPLAQVLQGFIGIPAGLARFFAIIGAPVERGG